MREAGRRGGQATGVDPSPLTLRLAHWISALRRARNVAWVQAAAEALSLPSASASVVWALSSLHDWDDLTKGLVEAGRILARGGCLLVIERLVPPGAPRPGSPRLSESRTEALAQQLEHAGLVDVSREHTRAGTGRS